MTVAREKQRAIFIAPEKPKVGMRSGRRMKVLAGYDQKGKSKEKDGSELGKQRGLKDEK